MTRKTCSPSFYAFLKKEYPRAFERREWLNFLIHLAFGPKDKKGSDGIVASQVMIAKTAGKEKELKNNSYAAIRDLESFRDNVMPGLRWSGWSFEEGRCRVLYPDFSKAVRDAIKREREIYNPTDRVVIADGTKWTPKKKKADRDETVKEALQLLEQAEPAMRPLIEYMNEQPPHALNDVVEANGEKCHKFILLKYRGIKREHALDQLNAVMENGMPVYAPSRKGCTVRASAIQEGLTQLPKRARKILCGGWFEFDLRNSQLAIVARRWGIPGVTKLLRTGKSIWEVMFEYYGWLHLKKSDRERYDIIKGYFKIALYSVVYGMEKKDAQGELTKALKRHDKSWSGERFFQHPIIQEILEARDRMMEKVRAEGGLKTLLDKWIAVAGHPNWRGGKGTEADVLKSILAEDAQAAEYWMLMPIVEYVRKSERVKIVLWQHDGFSAVVRRKGEGEGIIREWGARVEARAREGGFETGLEWEELREGREGEREEGRGWRVVRGGGERRRVVWVGGGGRARLGARATSPSIDTVGIVANTSVQPSPDQHPSQHPPKQSVPKVAKTPENHPPKTDTSIEKTLYTKVWRNEQGKPLFGRSTPSANLPPIVRLTHPQPPSPPEPAQAQRAEGKALQPLNPRQKLLRDLAAQR